MGFISKLFGRGKKIQKASIAILGSSGAGKTTLVRYLESGETVEDEVLTTLGIDYREKPVKIDSWEFSVIDVGGQTLYQKTFWSLGITQADAVIYVIDGLVKPDNKEDFTKAVGQFKYMLNLLDTLTPLLILVNKQDLEEKSPITAEEAFRLYEMEKITKKSIHLVPTSAKFGTGVNVALKWILEKLEYYK